MLMVDNTEFFREKRATAVLKHGILRRYAPVFASKAGLTTNGRVVFLDGYAGPGRYDDEFKSPGSPLLFAESAEFVSEFRDVTCFFVEKDDAHYANLEQVMAARGDPRLRPLHGTLEQHLHTILRLADGASLLAFLDPFGTALERARLVNDLLRRRSWPTEVLLHFSLITVARTGGIVRKIRREGREPGPAEEATLANLDRFLGGDWWRESFSHIAGEDDLAAATAIAERVAGTFQQQIRDETGYTSVSMPVRLRPDQVPRYLIVLFTRHPEGVWAFADVMGKASVEWHGAWRDAEASRVRNRDLSMGRATLFDELPDLEFDPETYDRDNFDLWVAEIKRNIVGLLARHRSIRLRDHAVEVYGTSLGSARIRHVRKAVKELHASGLIDNDGKNQFERRTTRLLKPLD